MLENFRANVLNLVEKAFATQQFALLATSFAFYDILARACAEIKILRFTFLGFRFLKIFSLYLSLLFLLQWLAFYWACLRLKNF